VNSQSVPDDFVKQLKSAGPNQEFAILMKSAAVIPMLLTGYPFIAAASRRQNLILLGCIVCSLYFIEFKRPLKNFSLALAKTVADTLEKRLVRLETVIDPKDLKNLKILMRTR
jgi:hypothetical protein